MITHKQIAKNVTYVGTAFGVNMLVGMLSAVVLTHLLGREEYGRYGYYYRIFAWVNTAAIMTVPPVLARYVAELRGAGKGGLSWLLFRRAVRIEFVIIGVVLLLSCSILWFCQAQDDYFYIAITGVFIAFILRSLFRTNQSFLEGCQAFGVTSRAMVAGAVVRAVGLGVLFVGGYANVSAAIFVLVLEQSVLLLCVKLGSRRFQTDRDQSVEQFGRDSKSLRRRLIDYGGSMTLAGMFSLVSWGYIEVFFIEYFWAGREGRASQMSYYCLAIALSTMSVRIFKAMSNTLLPAFAHLYGSGDHERISYGYKSATIATSLIGVFGCVLLAGVAEPLFAFVFPAELIGTVAVFRIMLIPALVLAITYPAGAAAPAMEGHRFLLNSNIILAIANLTLDIVLIPAYGAIGAAMVNAIIQSLGCLSGLWYVSIYRGLGFPVSRLIRICICSAVSGCVGWVICEAVKTNDLISLILGLLGGCVTYLIMLFIFKVIGAEEKRIFRSFFDLLPIPIKIKRLV